MSVENTPVLHIKSERLLTNAEFASLADVPPEVEWLAKRITIR